MDYKCYPFTASAGLKRFILGYNEEMGYLLPTSGGLGPKVMYTLPDPRSHGCLELIIRLILIQYLTECVLRAIAKNVSCFLSG